MISEQTEIGFKETLEILSRHKLVLFFCFMISVIAGILFYLYSPKKYRIGTKLLIYQNSKNKSLSGEWMNELEDFDYSNFVSNEMEILKSMNLRYSVLNSQQQVSKFTKHQFRENLSVVSIKNSDIIEITFKSDQPQIAIILLEELICLYQENSSNKIRESEKKTLAFLNYRVSEMKLQIELIENQLSEFKEKWNLSQPIEIYAENLGKKITEYQKFEKEILNKKSELDQLLWATQNQDYLFLPAQEYGTMPGIYNEKRLELNLFEKTIQSQHPEIIWHENLLEKIIKDLASKIRRDLIKLDSINLQNQVELFEFQNNWKKLPIVEKELKKIIREKNIIEELFAFLTQKREETEINLASQYSLFWVFDPPSNLILLSPNLFKVSALVFFFGLLVPSTLLIAQKSLDSKIYNKNEISKLTKIPILGALSLVKEKNKLVFNDFNYPLISEQFRMIRTNLGFLSPNSDSKTILISSCSSGEGKTFFSANFGLSVAFTGKKILLIEFDLRNPKLNNYLGGENETKGVSHYLSGQCDESLIIHSSKLHPNLYYIPSGPIPPNPGDLLKRDKLSQLFSRLKSHFDYLIVDSPPINLVADAFFLTEFADLTIFLIRINKTKTEEIKYLNELSLQGKIPHPSLVINANLPSSNLDNYYGYHQKKKNGLK